MELKPYKNQWCEGWHAGRVRIRSSAWKTWDGRRFEASQPQPVLNQGHYVGLAGLGELGLKGKGNYRACTTQTQDKPGQHSLLA